jgi:hypothetical protein
MKHFVTDSGGAKAAIKAILELDLSKKYEIDIKEHKSGRSLPSNAISHIWYRIISKARGTTPEQVKCECKLRFGVPILRAESETFRNFYDKAIKHSFTYEEKLQAMRFLPVTSIMSKEQMHSYLNDMQKTLAEEENIILMSPIDSEYYEWSQSA